MKKYVLLAVAALISIESQALEFMKCNSFDGKTLYGTFGKRSNSDGVKAFALEFVIFRSPAELQERIIYRSSQSSIDLVPITYNSGEFTFAIPSIGVDGAPSLESFNLHPYNAQYESAYIGTWTTKNSAGVTSAQVNCSVY